MKSIRLMLLAIFVIVSTVPFAFVATASGDGPAYASIGIYVGIVLFIIGFIMSFFKKEVDEVKDKEKSDENKK